MQAVKRIVVVMHMFLGSVGGDWLFLGGYGWVFVGMGWMGGRRGKGGDGVGCFMDEGRGDQRSWLGRRDNALCGTKVRCREWDGDEGVGPLLSRTIDCANYCQ